MEAALYDPVDGYYTRDDRQRWGRTGDYRTSPERSELFATTFARYFATLHEKLESPTQFQIVEFGGGAGHFAYNVLETLRERFATTFAATQYVFIDLNETAREKLQPFNERISFVSLAQLESIPAGVIFSNELLDAFPVYRITRRDVEFLELYVTLDSDNEFTWTTGPVSRPELVTSLQLEEGQVIEVNPAIEDWFATVTAKLERGFIVTVDYGAEAHELNTRSQGTLRGYSQHRFVDDLLASPGEYDLTSSVDWTRVKRCTESLGLESVQFQRLDRFLMQEGILEELELRLATASGEAERAAVTTSAKDMILPDGMASHFQVLINRRDTEK